MDWEALLQPAVIWFIIAVSLLLLEFVLPGLIVFFFALGAAFTGVLCLLFDLSINMQLAIFIASSIVFLLGLRKWMDEVFRGKTTENDMNEYVGEKAVVTTAIDPKKGGRVEFRGTGWNAEAEGEIEEGVMVEIIGHRNLLLKVKKL